MTFDYASLPPVRGKLIEQAPLAPYTWFRVGGPADALFLPADEDDLAEFLAALPDEVPVTVLGVGSNLIVRDGGIDGVVIRLMGAGWASMSADRQIVKAGAGALDLAVAKFAAKEGLSGLSFLSGIPGTLGGALRMNAGCYGSYVADHFVSAQGVLRDGTPVTLGPEDITFAYRQTDIAEGAAITSVTLRGPRAHSETLHARMEAQLAKRDATQPTKALSAGSTFRNPAGFSSTGRADDVHDLKAWKVIDAAGMRGATQGGAQMSEMHSNFLINTGTATAADLEGLGELVRKKVFQNSQIQLDWEIKRVGKPLQD